jgi:hypothetical protein
MADAYEIGSIPSLSAWQGETLAFKVSTSLGDRARFSKRAMPSPKGKTSIDLNTGVFTYQPSPEDAEEFAVWIRARADAKEESQKVSITPHPQLPSDFNVIEHASESMPDPASRFYTTFSLEDAGEESFNLIEQVGGGNGKPKIMTKKITVSGVLLIIDDEDKDEGSLYNRLKDRNDLRQLTLCAHEVIIRCELKVPGTNVTIYAHTTSFEDHDGKIARIDTTPLQFKAAAASAVGLSGQKAGDVRIYSYILGMPGNAHRVIANGSTGQSGRGGEEGASGTPKQKWDGRVRVENTDLDFSGDVREFTADGYAPPVYVAVYEKVSRSGRMKEEHRFDHPSKGWPGDGNPPDKNKLPGRPGRGGDGGSIYVLTDYQARRLNERSQLKAGADGDRAANLLGSKPGEPEESSMYRFVYQMRFFKPEKVVLSPNNSHTAKSGPGFTAPAAEGPETKPGKVHQVTDKAGEHSWLHPASVRALIAYSNDAYLSGHANADMRTGSYEPAAAVRRWVERYQRDVSAAAAADKNELSWPLLANELATLKQRLDGPYDYFGNPAGWVPMLSFQANYTLFQNEMESAVRAMFLAYWIQNTQARAQAVAKILGEAKKRLGEETDRALADYNAAELKVGALQTEMASIAVQIEATRKFVSDMKETLTKQVQNDLKTEHALRASAKILGGVMQLIPVGQPVLGSFGKAFTVLGDVDVDKPAGSLGGVAGAFAPVMTDVVGPKLAPIAKEKAEKLFSGLFQAKQLAKTEAETKAEEKKAEFKKEVAKAELKKKVKDTMDKKEAAKESIMGGFSQFAVSEDDVKERLEKVLADTPAYGEAVKTIEGLNERKKSFAEELHATIQAIDHATTTIVNNQLAILDLRDQQDLKLEQLNLEALQSVQDMGRRARERLLLYQYYLLKSFHYLMLEDMPAVDFLAQKLFDAFSDMVIEKPGKGPVSPDGMLTESQFKTLSTVFEQQLKAIAQRIIDRYQEGGNKRELTSRLVALSSDQVETLNSSAKQVDLDMLWYLDRKEEDVRITGISVDSIELAEPLPKKPSNLSLDYVHDGVSKVRLDGRVLLFRSGQYRIEGKKGQGGGTQPRTDIHWGTKVKYNPSKGSDALTVEPTKPDPEQESLVQHLIGAPNGATHPMMNFRPGAWAKLAVKRSGDEGVKIKSLTLEVHYVFQSINDKVLRTVAVRVLDDAQPYIRCDTEDANGRSDGVGSFLRTFQKNKNQVTLRAPSRYGARPFRGWRVDGNAGEPGPVTDQELFTKDADLKLNLLTSSNYIVEPVFAPTTTIPVNDKGEKWPACPEGWVFDDWMFINGSRDPLTIDEVFMYGVARGFSPAVNEPVGTNYVKLSFERLKLLPGESTKISVCVIPETPSTWSARELSFRWKVGNYYAVDFNRKGDLIQLGVYAPKSMNWDDAPKVFDYDAGDRSITYARPKT